ncbi:GcrA cell cycle regulator [uncultured Caudovirales phage]|uniref:GcrA cell cycle regulator n=1 Tax=uncultured Caudovirales phage TaxID=2100421 RepID=A0A6J5MGV5_9CAUD|nr:GcrA cell cycle regulator [uncultured Caudovirales phage]CAB4189693.1 GcrA cell cycle regulator [uncultured Caudovirales phage]
MSKAPYQLATRATPRTNPQTGQMVEYADWTPQAIALLGEWWPNHSLRWIAAQFGVSHLAVAAKGHRLKLPKKVTGPGTPRLASPDATPVEPPRLRFFFVDEPPAPAPDAPPIAQPGEQTTSKAPYQLSARPGRGPTRSRSGNPVFHADWTPEALGLLREWWPTKTSKEMAALFGITPMSVIATAHRHGLPKKANGAHKPMLATPAYSDAPPPPQYQKPAPYRLGTRFVLADDPPPPAVTKTIVSQPFHPSQLDPDPPMAPWRPPVVDPRERLAGLSRPIPPARECQWIDGDVGLGRMPQFCAAPVRNVGCPYCAAHAKRAFSRNGPASLIPKEARVDLRFWQPF